MYTDIFKYVTANERGVRRMKAREDFECIHRKMQKCKDDEDWKEYYRLRRIEHNALLASIDAKERYHRTYREKPETSVTN